MYLKPVWSARPTCFGSSSSGRFYTDENNRLIAVQLLRCQRSYSFSICSQLSKLRLSLSAEKVTWHNCFSPWSVTRKNYHIKWMCLGLASGYLKMHMSVDLMFKSLIHYFVTCAKIFFIWLFPSGLLYIFISTTNPSSLMLISPIVL